MKPPISDPETLDSPHGQAAQVLRQFRVVFNAVRTHFQQVEKCVGISGAQVWVLNVIKNAPGIGVNKLAQAMDIHQSTASNLIRQLVKNGHVRTVKSSTDRRGIHLYIEPLGLELLSKAPGPYEGLLPNALRQLSPETLASLQRDLGELMLKLRADEEAGGIPLAEL